MGRNYQTAVFTLVNNQPEFQEIWIKYYSQFPFRLVILEHVFEGEDHLVSEEMVSETALLEHHRVVKKELFDHTWMCNLTEQVQRELLKEQPTVIYTDIDELIVPKECDLNEYCRRNRENVVRCHGHHLVERKYLVKDTVFDKPIVTRIPVKWIPGWHGCAQGGEVDGNLWLIHLHRMDYEIAKKHWMARQKVQWDADAEKRKLSWQNHFPTEEEFREWFYTEKPKHVRKPVPDWLQEKLRGIVF